MTNPYLDTQNPYTEYERKDDGASKSQLEFQRLCYEVFLVEPSGKRLMEILKERYVMQACFSPTHPQATQLAMFWEGFKEAIRTLQNYGVQHAHYIGGNTNVTTRNTSS